MPADVVLCAEASHAKGMGHAYRCARLARSLRSAGMTVTLVSNDYGPARRLWDAAGLPWYFAPTDRPEESGWEGALLDELQPRLWVNDRLETDARHAALVRERTRLAGIDDTGEGGALAHLLFLTMPCTFMPHPGPGIFQGVEYLALDPAFRAAGRLRSNSSTPRLLVSMGGSDTWGATPWIAEQLAALDLPAALVTGPAFEHEAQLAAVLGRRGARLERLGFVDDLAALFADFDVLICAGGLTPFEAASAGLPSICLATEPHERANASYVGRHGLGVMLGERQGEAFTGSLSHALDSLRAAGLETVSRTAFTHVDGGGLARITSILLENLSQ